MSYLGWDLTLEQKTWRHLKFSLPYPWWNKQVQLCIHFSSQSSYQFPTTCRLQKYLFCFRLIKQHHTIWTRSYFQPRLTRLFLILSQGCHRFSYHFISKFTIFSTKKFVLIVLLIHKIPRFKIWCISRFWQKCKNLGCLKNCLVSITLL